MSAVFLIAIMLWHEEGQTFSKRYVIIPTPNATTCEAVADDLRAQWRKEVSHATISIECVPVAMFFKA